MKGKIKNRFKHWTFRYILNRIALWITEFFHPNWPWLTRESINLIEKYISKEHLALEFGGGRSTEWLSRRVKYLISVENNPSWHETIKNKSLGNVRCVLAQDKSLYTGAASELDDETIDFILIDGDWRDECAENSWRKLKPGGIMVIDNINRYFAHETFSPASIKSGYESEKWESFFASIVTSKKLWTSNGITDTLLIYKA